jgi:glyoxylate reductase
VKPRVLVTHRLLPEALAYLRRHTRVEGGRAARGLTAAKLKEKIRDKEGLLCFLVDRIDSGVMDSAPFLRVVANCAVGYDNIDLDHARKKGILVTNTPGVLTDTTADLTWALILAAARKIPQADRYTRRGRFRGWELDLFLGKELGGKRLGIIGMGRIGRAVARRARAFGMEVVYSDTSRMSPEEENKYGAAFLPLDDLLFSSDIVSIHASLNPQTFHRLSAEKLRLMKKEAILINAARGPIVDENALAGALARRELWAAGLDVYENEPDVNPALLRLDNIILLPHIGSATRETRSKMAGMAARNLVQGLSGERPENLVN